MFYYHHTRAHVFSGRRVRQKHIMIHWDAIISTESENSCNLAQTPTFFSDRYALVTDLDLFTRATWLTIDIYVWSQSIFVAYRLNNTSKVYNVYIHRPIVYNWIIYYHICFESLKHLPHIQQSLFNSCWHLNKSRLDFIDNVNRFTLEHVHISALISWHSMARLRCRLGYVASLDNTLLELKWLQNIPG